MNIERYISLLVVLVVGLFLANASWAEAIPAQSQTPTALTCVQCSAPVNTWCVPATSGAAAPAAGQSTKAPARVVKRADTPWDVLGEILATPFVVAQCILAGCP